MDAVRGFKPASASCGRGGGTAPEGWRAPHRAQKTSAAPTSVPHWLQNGIYHYIRYASAVCSGKRGEEPPMAHGRMRIMRTWRTCILLLICAAALPAAKNLEVYFIDVEGGQATLFVS